MQHAPEQTGEYQPLAWQIVIDGLGYSSVHETDEDGKPGDLVAHTYGDHINLIVAAPRLLQSVAQLLRVVRDALQDDSLDASTDAGAILCGDVCADAIFAAQSAIAKARGQ